MASAASYRSVAVIGAGAWGTALASAAARAGRAVTLYARDPAQAESIQAAHENKRLPGMAIDAAIEVTGDIVRARQEARRGYTAESQRRRAELAAAARRGGLAEGETVHIGWRMLDADAVDRGEASGPLSSVGGVVSVRWSAAGGFLPLERYLDERVGLLLEPPPGA